MSNANLCVFDLDGTLYPKESEITYEIRNQVIANIAEKNLISFDSALSMYRELPKQFSNPYDGLKSVNVSSFAYQNVFNSINVEKYVHQDYKLIALLEQLNKISDIIVVSFAPIKYVEKVLSVIGVKPLVKKIYSVSEQSNFSKAPIFNSIINQSDYSSYFAIGDDLINDVLPAEKAGFYSFHINFEKPHSTIYSIIEKLCKIMMYEINIPHVMRVENISICNENCVICPYGTINRDKGIMSNELFKKLIIEHSSLVKQPKLIFPASIGEPFLDEAFIDKVGFASRYYNDISTFTNASVLTTDKFVGYVESGGTELMLTLHGYTAEMHSSITRTNFYNKVRSNIESIVETNSGLIHPITLFLDIYANDSSECSHYINEMRQMGVIAQRLDLKNTHNWGGQVNLYSQKKASERCSRIYEQFAVQYNGIVVPCCIDVEGGYILGDANKQTLKEIFSSKIYRQLVSMEKDGTIRCNKLCSKCNV